MLTSLVQLDTQLFWLINLKLTSAALDPVMLTLSAAWFWWAIAGLVAATAVLKKNHALLKTLLLFAIAMGISDAFAFEVLKPSVGRERPCRELQNVRLVSNRCGGDFGFPSNHAANGFAAATVFWMRSRRGRYFHNGSPSQDKLAPSNLRSQKFISGLPFLLAGVVGYTRVYLGVHFPLDVTMGAVFGIAVGYSCIRTARSWSKANRFFWPVIDTKL